MILLDFRIRKLSAFIVMETQDTSTLPNIMIDFILKFKFFGYY